MTNNCFHCSEVVPIGINLFVTINHTSQAMCCIGCQAVSQTIVDNGLTQYYSVRTEPAQKAQSLVPEQLQKNKLLDEAVLQSEFVFQGDSQEQDSKEAILTIDGMSCAACAWLIEMQLDKLKGLLSITVNATSQRATIRWQDNAIKLSAILLAIENIGYQALPFKANDAELNNKKQSKAFIKRLGISGILMMQIMMIAVGLYFGAFTDMAEHNKIYLRWVSFILATPIICYGALPFYTGAIKALKAKRLSMDVPVSIAIILAFSASAWATITQQGEVYFESVSMFTFLLLIGKFLEFRARSRAAEVSANLLKLMPMTATKVITINDTKNSDKEKNQATNTEVLIAAKQLIKGDIVIIKPGEVVPADGIITSGISQLNEAMLSGEQLPISKTINDNVFAGTINGDGNITVQIKQSTGQSFLSQLIRLSEQSQAHKPKIAKLSDKIAQYFVALILLTSIATAIYWQQHMPEEAFWITLSVLVATCPCALSLATPTGLTCATTRLNRAGIMIKGGHVMETMPQINCFAFDKTGTLTTGEFTINKVELINNDLNITDSIISGSSTTGSKDTGEKCNQEQVLAIAAALEAHSEHPIAKSFAEHRDYNLTAEKVTVHSGKGVTGTIDNIAYAIGKLSWLEEDINPDDINTRTHNVNISGASCILMANKQIIAAFYLVDKIRDEAFNTLSNLNKNNKTLLLSGDSQIACDTIAQNLPVNITLGGLSAQDKMQQLKKAQAQGYKVAMTGDGVNDSPVFGAAHVSIAMGCGADITKSGADVILLNNKLSSINTLIKVSHRTRRIIFQNYLWAFGYNAIVLPLAVAGHITPYMAVIGMSASSILVISNSLRLLKE
ncbi:heavy metal translocating P-type ATPase [Colwellia psychrerythraea]|uniref:Heavy metal translocating P-type ATPase n=1 Tax=Colwellia psychrerythraea TaxID=28229 RepID=A0A099KI53_COLPS|nr:heavy metal translocating P-type ATPase [Colwellia psychrerythraea]KGJ89940.1 heavy metal translocating P-type ATPase [Colwellia psychrerythraea]